MEAVTVGSPAGASRVVALAEALDLTVRCNTLAVEAGALSQTYPSFNAVVEEAESSRGLVVLVLDDTTPFEADAVGYMVARADPGPRGGGYVAWAGIVPGDDAAVDEVWRHLIAAGTARYGHLWGRIRNRWLRDACLRHPDVTADPTDPEVVSNGPHPEGAGAHP